MNFASDNCSGVAPQISQALTRHAAGMATPYGDSDLDRVIERRFDTLFETQCSVFFVGTGTAANSLAIAATMKPGGVIFSHAEAHVIANEGGAPEFLSGGGRIHPVGGADLKIDPVLLDGACVRYSPDFNHLGQGTLVTMTQASEVGTVYDLDHIEAIGLVAQKHGLPLHMDGARFANALVTLDCSPAEMTWKRGVDMVSFGATKNGCWCAEALIVFNRDLVSQFKFTRKRAGHLFSKTRFISAQFEAYLEDDLWLDLARHSNAMGDRLKEIIRRSNRVRLLADSPTNQIFFIADRKTGEALLAEGAIFYDFPVPSDMSDAVGQTEQVYRLVASFSTTHDDVEAFAKLLAE